VNSVKNKLKIYIAGPDVFELDAKEIGTRLSALCEEYGFSGFYPLDNAIEASAPHKMAEAIFYANKKMLDDCDIVIANLNPFRGKEADSGTVWEVGYAVALGKDVYGYMADTGSYASKFNADEKNNFKEFIVDNHQRIIEDFELPINLMIACSVKIIKGDFQEVLSRIKQNR